MTRIATIEKPEMTQVIQTDANGRTIARLGSIRPDYLADGTPRHIITSYITRQRWTANVDRAQAISDLAIHAA